MSLIVLENTQPTGFMLPLSISLSLSWCEYRHKTLSLRNEHNILLRSPMLASPMSFALRFHLSFAFHLSLRADVFDCCCGKFKRCARISLPIVAITYSRSSQQVVGVKDAQKSEIKKLNAYSL